MRLAHQETSQFFTWIIFRVRCLNKHNFGVGGEVGQVEFSERALFGGHKGSPIDLRTGAGIAANIVVRKKLKLAGNFARRYTSLCSRARYTASVRLPTLSLERALLTRKRVVESLIDSRAAISWLVQPLTSSAKISRSRWVKSCPGGGGCPHNGQDQMMSRDCGGLKAAPVIGNLQQQCLRPAG